MSDMRWIYEQSEAVTNREGGESRKFSDIRDVSANPTRKQSVRRSVAIGLLVHENSR